MWKRGKEGERCHKDNLASVCVSSRGFGFGVHFSTCRVVEVFRKVRVKKFVFISWNAKNCLN